MEIIFDGIDGVLQSDFNLAVAARCGPDGNVVGIDVMFNAVELDRERPALGRERE